MILVGQYDSPYTRRVAVSLHLLGFDFEHDTRSVFADFDSMRTTNPLGRIPSLILDDGTTLIDSGRSSIGSTSRSDRNARCCRQAGWRANRRCNASRWPAARSTRSWALATSA